MLHRRRGYAQNIFYSKAMYEWKNLAIPHGILYLKVRQSYVQRHRLYSEKATGKNVNIFRDILGYLKNSPKSVFLPMDSENDWIADVFMNLVRSISIKSFYKSSNLFKWLIVTQIKNIKKKSSQVLLLKVLRQKI